MPRHHQGRHATTRQKGTVKTRGKGRLSSYARQEKSRKADRYERIYLTGNYSKTAVETPERTAPRGITTNQRQRT